MPLLLVPLGYFAFCTCVAWAVWETCFPGAVEIVVEAWEK